MKAIVVAQYGGVEEAKLRNIADPTLGDGEGLIRIEAASVNPLDVKLISGAVQGWFPLELPFIVGTDFSGVVLNSDGVFTPGQRVFGRLEPAPPPGQAFGKTGAFAGRVSVRHSCLAAIPETISFTDAAALPTAAGTAYQTIREIGKVQPGQTVLIHAAAGGVGGFAVQFAKSAGATVIATASAANREYVSQLGADIVIDYRSQDFTSVVKDVDLVLDTLGGETHQQSYRTLRNGGTLLSTVAPPDDKTAREFGVHASFVFHTTSSTRLEQFAAAVVDHGLRIPVSVIHPLENAPLALAQIATGHTKGKVVLKMN
jgi:NADPH:quinone reductase-like Zn-dependent oxidoreductase